MFAVVYGILLLSVALSKCTSLEGECTSGGMAKFTSQFNVNWKGIPTYVDQLSNVYDQGNKCAMRTYTMLFHNRLNCTTEDNKKFKCKTVIESAWVRIWDTSYYQTIIKNCGMKWHEQYQDVMKVPCVVGETDFMYYVKERVGETGSLTVTINNRVPEEYGGMHYGGECVWEYEIEGFWSTLVITIFSVAIGVVVVFVIGLYIYANKHRKEKRGNQLNRSLVEGDVKPSSV